MALGFSPFGPCNLQNCVHCLYILVLHPTLQSLTLQSLTLQQDYRYRLSDGRNDMPLVSHTRPKQFQPTCLCGTNASWSYYCVSRHVSATWKSEWTLTICIVLCVRALSPAFVATAPFYGHLHSNW